MMLIWGNEGIQLYNDACQPLFGNDYSAADPLGKPAKEFYAETWQYIGPLLKEVYEQGKSTWQEDLPIPIFRNGVMEQGYWTFSHSPVYGDGGNVEGILIVCTETTNSILARREAEKVKNEFKNLADNIPNLAWMAQADGNIYWYNKKWYDYTGTKPEDMMGWGWQRVHHPHVLPVVMEKWQDSLSHEKAFEMVFPIKGADGVYRQFLTRVAPMFDENGTLTQWFGTNTDISSQILADQELKESEKRFRTLAQVSNVLIAESDESSNATYFNEAWEEFTGKSSKELVAYGWANLIHAEDRDVFLNHYAECFEKQIPFKGEFRMLNAKGEYRWILAQGPARFRPDGSFAGFVSSSVDITETKEREDLIQENVHRIKNIIEGAPFLIGLYTGPNMIVEFANEMLIQAMGKGQDVIGKPYSEILPELAGEEVFAQMNHVYETGETVEVKNKLLDIIINGEPRRFYYTYHFRALRNRAGEIYGIINTAVDVTELNLALLQVAQSELNLRTTILQAPVAMCILRGEKFEVEMANERMYEIWGRGQEEMLNRPIFEGLSEAANQGFEQILENVYTNGTPHTIEAVPVWLPRQGSRELVYVNATYAPHKNKYGQVTSIVIVSVDVTAQVLARHKIEAVVAERTEELAVANKSLLRSNEELGQFAYIASHDLQEPLRKISTFSRMLEARLHDSVDAASQKLLGKIITSAGRMSTLIKDVLTYSELGGEHRNFVPVDLNEVLAAALTEFDLLIEEKGARIEAEALPVLEAVPQQMNQFFSNMLGNSLKFSRQNLAPHIRFSTRPVEAVEKAQWQLQPELEYVCITIRDNGIGFKPEYASRIFNVFQRLHGKAEYAGTGIGLAMCKKIAHNHHGSLHAEGSTEEGAVFHVLLPLVQPV